MALSPKDTYPGRIDLTDSGYPYGKAQNESGPNNNDGTPLEKQLVNDVFGLQQALLSAAGITPSGVPDEVGASDYLTALDALAQSHAAALGVAGHVARTAAGSYSGDFYCAAHGQVTNSAPPNETVRRTVIAGTSGEIQVSTNRGRTWAVAAPAAAYSGNFFGAAYGASMFVLVGTSGEIQTSPDGLVWTHRTPAGGFAGVFEDVTYGAGLFVAVGRNGEIQTSPDGITWTKRTPAASYADDFNAITYGGGLFVAVGETHEIQTSPDGITWTRRTAATYAGNFLGVAYGNGTYVAVGTAAQIQTSPDGITWTTRAAAALYTSAFSDVVFFGSLLVAIGQGGGFHCSRDGKSWRELVPMNGAFTLDLQAAVDADGSLVAVGYSASIRTSLQL